MQALGMAEKQISVGGQVFSQAVNYFYLCSPLEIDKDVAAENQVKRASDCVGFPSEIEPLKSDDPPEGVRHLDLTFLRAEPLQKELSLVLNRHVGDFLGGPDPRRSLGQNLGGEICSQNLDIPSGGRLKMRQNRHGQRVRFFTCGTCCAPDPKCSAPPAGVSLRQP